MSQGKLGERFKRSLGFHSAIPSARRYLNCVGAGFIIIHNNPVHQKK